MHNAIASDASPRRLRSVEAYKGRWMSTEDQRERDQMWKRIDQHGGRLNDLERAVTEVKGQADENGRNVADVSTAVHRAEAATNQVHLDLNLLIGQSRAIKKIALGLSAILIVIEVFNIFSEDIMSVLQ